MVNTDIYADHSESPCWESDETHRHFVTVHCPVCNARVAAGMSLGEVTDRYHTGHFSQYEFDGYCYTWDLLSPTRSTPRRGEWSTEALRFADHFMIRAHELRTGRPAGSGEGRA